MGYISVMQKRNLYQKCYQAKICIHNGKEKCGRDPDGNIRRFLDLCDIKEYNCLKGTEYTKVRYQECSDLPPIDKQVSVEMVKKVSGEDENQELGGKFIENKDHSGHVESQEDGSEHGSDEEPNAFIPTGILIKINPDKDSSSSKERRRNKTTIATTKKTIKPIHPRKAAVINEYWCWRARYCHKERNQVCGRDRRLGQKTKFNSECHLFHHNCDFESVTLYYLSSCLSLTNHPSLNDNDEVRDKFAKFHCFKLKTCTPGGDRVCGFDDTTMYLAEFEDMCMLHKVNCEKRGFFTYIDSSICEGQKKFQERSKDSDLDRNMTSI